jgi:Ca2+-binding RTX toxin-like protein
MAKIVLKGDTEITLSEATGFGIWADSVPVYSSETVAVIGALDGNFVFEGSGFTSFDNHGYAMAGTIDAFSLVTDIARVDWTQFSVDAIDFRNALKNQDALGFQDILFGDDDTFVLNKGGGNVDGFAGNDIVKGNSGHDTIAGGQGDDTLRGGRNGDILEGGDDGDTLTGGTGADVFVFRSVTDSTTGGIDTITDLKLGDVIDLANIDADSNLIGDQEFTVDGAAFDGFAAELIMFFDEENDRTLIQGDVDGDASADFTIRVTGDHIDYNNFVL